MISPASGGVTSTTTEGEITWVWRPTEFSAHSVTMLGRPRMYETENHTNEASDHSIKDNITDNDNHNDSNIRFGSRGLLVSCGDGG